MATDPRPLSSDVADRVRSSTHPEVQARLDRDLADRLERLPEQGRDAINLRLFELDRESDIERLLEANASALALTGVILGATVGRRWLLLPAVVLPFLLQHAIQGWCPPVGLFRRFGVRTRAEIDAERYALKALRGDFDGLAGGRPDADRVLAAVRR
jgi:hypothetical protein